MNTQMLMIADTLGIIAFALSGLFVSTRQKLDILGLFIITFLTALGGGVIRDVLLSKTPTSFINYTPTLLVFSVIIMGILLKLHQKQQIEKHYLFVLFDTLGLVSFAITGALLGIESKFNIFGISFLALISAVGGGVIRDMLLNEVPLMLKSDFYGSIALLIGAGIYLLHTLNILHNLSLLSIFSLGIIVRLIAYHRDWHLPKL